MSLTKSSERVLVSPAVPAQASVAPVPFRMYAPPMPLGWRYKAYTTDGINALPNSVATFNAWPVQIYKPQIYTSTGTSTYTFMTVDELVAYLRELGVSSLGFDQVSPVYDNEGNVTGYMVWRAVAGDPVLQPPTWWGPLPDMTLVTFPDVATLGPYGYPAGEGMFRGYFDAPTLTGTVRCWGNYWKDHNGVLLRIPEESDALPPYCSYRDSVRFNPARVVVMADFPGRAAVPAVPAVTVIDGKLGWNAGATSVQAFAGDCRVTFTPYVVAAAVLGLTAAPRANVTDPNLIEFAFRFDMPNGDTLRYCVFERGVRIGPYRTASTTSVFVIERVNGRIAYKVDGEVVYDSEVLSFQTLCVGTSLYYGGDGVY